MSAPLTAPLLAGKDPRKGVPCTYVSTTSEHCFKKADSVVLQDPAEIQSRHVKRARTKFRFRPLMKKLADLKSPLEKAYRNSIYCCHAYDQVGDTLTTTYCKNRWCPLCNRIRMARMIDYYEPVVSGWPAPHFVTITRKTVEDRVLPQIYKTNLAVFNRVKDAMRRHRTDPLRLRALRKTECTYNAFDDRYHLHYHVITSTAAEAERLVEGWVVRHPAGIVDVAAQDIRPCTERGLVELLKYAAKLSTNVGSRKRYVPPAALDTIFQSFRNRRLVQPIGFSVPKPILNIEEDFDTERGVPALTRLGESVYWEWKKEYTDWVDAMTGDVLSGYTPSEEDLELVGRPSENLSP